MIPSAIQANRDFLVKVILPMVSLVIGLLVVSAFGIYLTASYQTSVAIDGQYKLAEASLHVRGRTIEKYAYDYGEWDEAVNATVGKFDFAWVDSNYGDGAASSYGANMVFVINQDNQSIYSSVDGKGGNEPVRNYLTWGFDDLLKSWRANSDRRAPAHAMIMASGHPAIAAIAPIRPFADKTHDQYTGFGILIVFYVDNALLSEFSANYLLPNLRLMRDGEIPAEPGAVLKISDGDGHMIGMLQWDAARPGDELIRRVLPWVCGVIPAFLLLTFMVLRQSARAAHLVRESEMRAMTDALTNLPNPSVAL